MFTGIITSIGTVAEVRAQGNARRVSITTTLATSGWQMGCSVACSGVCLTVVSTGLGNPVSPEPTKGSAPSASKKASRGALHYFTAELSPETLSCTTLSDWKKGTKVNLEPALKLGDELGGHIVTGHVDGVGKVAGTETAAGGHIRVTFEAPKALLPLIAAKGSITIDGVSLTVNGVKGKRFTVNLIPHTLGATTLGLLKKDSAVNLEADMLARYVARLAEFKG